MPDDLPPAPPEEPADAGEKIFAELEQRIAELELQRDLGRLSAEGKARELFVREISQRIWIRWVAICLAVAVMVFMGCVLWHAVHAYFWGPFVTVPQSVAIAMFLGPIVSITTITVMLAIGAFRKFRDDDVGPVGASTLAAEGAKSVLGS